MNYFNKSIFLQDSENDWTLWGEFLALISIILFFLFGYFVYNAYNDNNNVTYETVDTNIQSSLSPDIEVKADIVSSDEDVSVNDEAAQGSIKSEPHKLEAVAQDAVKAAADNSKAFDKIYEAYKLLHALDKNANADAIKDYDPASHDVLADDLFALTQQISKSASLDATSKNMIDPVLKESSKAEAAALDKRFILSSEVLFPLGSSYLTKKGKRALDPVVKNLKTVVRDMPNDSDWIIRIDGHADRLKILRKDLTNRELSAQRSLEIVKYLEANGIPPKRLVATAFGSHHPRSAGKTKADHALDRRIEIKITNR